MEHVEVNSDIRFYALGDEGDSGTEAGAKTSRAAKFKTQANVKAGRPLSRLLERYHRSLQRSLVHFLGEIRDDQQQRDPQSLAQFQASAEMVEVDSPLLPLRQQQAPLIRSGCRCYPLIFEQPPGVCE